MAQMRPKPRSIRSQSAPIRTRSGSNPTPSQPAHPANPAANSIPLKTLRVTPMDRLRCSHTPSVTEPLIQLMPKVPPRVGGRGYWRISNAIDGFCSSEGARGFIPTKNGSPKYGRFAGHGRASLGDGRNMQLISHFHPQPGDRSARQLQHATHPEADRGQPEWRQTVPQLDHLKIAVQSHHIDFEGHEKSMNTGRGSDPQPPSSVQTSSTEQAEQPLPGSIGQLDGIAHCAAPSCVRHSEHRNRTARQSSTTFRLFASCGRR